MMRTLMNAARGIALGAACILVLAAGAGVGAARAEDPVATYVPGRPSLLLGAYDITALGYTTEEFFVSGTATSYRLEGPAGLDGRWSASPDASAPYVTRLVVVRPSDPAKFNGTVVVEWLNVTAGVDAAPDWNAAHRELIRGGYAYIAVSAQRVGVEGGASLTGMDMSLKKTNPKRYAGLNHPGDAFAYDIYSQAGRLARLPSPGGVLGPLTAKQVIAAGESQSATFLTTYVDAVDPLAKVYDGFLIHSRFGAVARIDGASIIGAAPGSLPTGVKIRTDVRAPVITVISESDLLGARLPGFYSARQPDNDRLRIWEMPGTAHADNYTVQAGFIDSGATPVEKLAAAYAPMSKFLGAQLAKPMNFAPQHHYVVEAALWSLDRWLKTGEPPPKAARMTLNHEEPPALVLDANGLAKGGIRTPWVDVPTARLSGAGNSGHVMAALFGLGEPFDAATLARLYPGGKADYLKKFEASLAASIKAGFILPADRQEILDLAAAMYPAAS